MSMNQNFGNLLKEAKNMQERMQKAQAELTELTITGDAGAGKVKVKMDGTHYVKRVVLDPSLENEALSILEDLIAAAVNDAVRKIEKESQKKIQQLTTGLNIPPDLLEGVDEE